MKRITLIIISILLTQFVIFAQFKLANIFDDHMVLQRNDMVKIWGTASPNESIEISASWSSEIFNTKADNNGNWISKIYYRNGVSIYIEERDLVYY